MGFEEFLAEGSLNYILALMMLPLVIGMLLVGYLVFAWRRRRNKNKMKLGVGSLSDTIDPMVNDDDPPAAVPVPTESEVMPMASSTGLDDLDLGPLSQKPEQPEASSPSPEGTSEPLELQPQSAPAAAAPPEELLRLLRDPATGQLIVAVGSQQYYRLADITDKKIGQFVLNVAAHLLAFTNGVVATDAGVKPVYTPKVGPAPEPVAKPAPAPAPASSSSSVQPLVPPPSPEAEAAFLASLQSFTPSRPEPARTRSGLFGSRRPAPPPDEPLQLNLADEINDLVQARLRQSSLAESTTIDITSALSGGIVITVNGQIYDSPDEVTDETARNIIKSAIKEWESR